MAHLIVPQTGVQVLRGEVFLSSADSTKYQNVPLGLVQEFDVDDTISLKELKGPRSRMPVAVFQSERKVNGSCKFASVNAQAIALLRGATLTTATTGTGGSTKTITKAAAKGSDNILPCGIELFDVDNENGPHYFFYYVVFKDFKAPQKLDDYTIWDCMYEAYPDPVTGNVYDMFFPGDQTTAFTLPTQYTADGGLTTAQTDYGTIHTTQQAPLE